MCRKLENHALDLGIVLVVICKDFQNIHAKDRDCSLEPFPLESRYIENFRLSTILDVGLEITSKAIQVWKGLATSPTKIHSHLNKLSFIKTINLY